MQEPKDSLLTEATYNVGLPSAVSSQASTMSSMSGRL